MKRNAITRIIIYGLVILALVAVLLIGLGVGDTIFGGGGDYTKGSGTADAQKVSSLKIDWVAGSITIQTGDVEQITFSDSCEEGSKYEMGYSVKDGTLNIKYSSKTITINMGSMPSKDLTVTVPRDWECKKLELDGASLDISVDGLTVGELDLDGAANDLEFCGSLGILECDGASNDLTVVCTNSPTEIDLDGASVTLDLTLPEDCGYWAEMEGLSCNFHSAYHHEHRNGRYHYGNEKCEINADGVSCTINIHKPE